MYLFIHPFLLLLDTTDAVCFQEQQEMFTVIAAVLHLGNVTFDLDDADAARVTDPNGAVKMASVSSLHSSSFGLEPSVRVYGFS